MPTVRCARADEPTDRLNGLTFEKVKFIIIDDDFSIHLTSTDLARANRYSERYRRYKFPQSSLEKEKFNRAVPYYNPSRINIEQNDSYGNNSTVDEENTGMQNSLSIGDKLFYDLHSCYHPTQISRISMFACWTCVQGPSEIYRPKISLLFEVDQGQMVTAKFNWNATPKANVFMCNNNGEITKLPFGDAHVAGLEVAYLGQPVGPKLSCDKISFLSLIPGNDRAEEILSTLMDQESYEYGIISYSRLAPSEIRVLSPPRSTISIKRTNSVDNDEEADLLLMKTKSSKRVTWNDAKEIVGDGDKKVIEDDGEIIGNDGEEVTRDDGPSRPININPRRSDARLSLNAENGNICHSSSKWAFLPYGQPPPYGNRYRSPPPPLPSHLLASDSTDSTDMSSESQGSVESSVDTMPHAMAPHATTSQVTAPQVTASQAAAPQITAPQVTAPQIAAPHAVGPPAGPHATANQATGPQATGTQPAGLALTNDDEPFDFTFRKLRPHEYSIHKLRSPKYNINTISELFHGPKADKAEFMSPKANLGLNQSVGNGLTEVYQGCASKNNEVSSTNRPIPYSGPSGNIPQIGHQIQHSKSHNGDICKCSKQGQHPKSPDSDICKCVKRHTDSSGPATSKLNKKTTSMMQTDSIIEHDVLYQQMTDQVTGDQNGNIDDGLTCASNFTTDSVLGTCAVESALESMNLIFSANLKISGHSSKLDPNGLPATCAPPTPPHDDDDTWVPAPDEVIRSDDPVFDGCRVYRGFHPQNPQHEDPVEQYKKGVVGGIKDWYKWPPPQISEEFLPEGLKDFDWSDNSKREKSASGGV